MQEAKKPAPEVQALLDQAEKARAAGKPDQAIALYEQALKKVRELKDQLGEAIVLGNLGLVYKATEQHLKSLVYFQAALPLFRALGNKAYEANTLFEIGAAYQLSNQPDQALEFDLQARPLFHELGNQQREADTLLNLGALYQIKGQPEKAVESYRQALPLYRAAGDKEYEANTLGNLGGVLSAMGQLQEALAFYQQAVDLQHTLGQKAGEASMLNDLGLVYQRMGQSEKALEVYQKALPLARALGNKPLEMNALNGLGNTSDAIGQLQKAREYYQQALQAYRALGDRAGEAKVLSNLGIAYQRVGQPEKALPFYLQALPAHRALGNQQYEANTLANLGTIYRDIGQPKKALDFYQRALALRRRLGDRGGEASELGSLGILYLDAHQLSKAGEHFQQALSLFRAVGDKSGEASALNNLALTYEAQGLSQKARELSQQALALDEVTGDKEGQAFAHSRLAFAEEKQKHPVEAEVHYAQAIALFEALRDNLGGLSEAKSSFLSSKLSTYYRYLSFLLDQGKVEKAFALAQKTKARSLLDLMASGRVRLDGDLTPEERQQEQALRWKADLLNQQMVKEGVENEVGAKKRYAALKEQLKQTESELQTLTDTLYARHPQLAQKRAAKTATLTEIAPLLPADTALLDYIVLSQEKLVLFVVMRSGVKALTLPVAYKSLASKASHFRAACADPRKDYKAVAAELYTLLLAPAAKHLMGVKRLVVCPDGALWDIPFQALLSNGQFLAQRFELAYAYSATGAQAALVAKAGRKKPTQTLLAFANPDFGSSKRFGDLESVPGQRPIDAPSRPIDAPSRPIDAPSRPIDAPSRAFDSVSRAGKIVALPGTQREADALKKLIPGATLMTGKNAQEGKAKQLASQYKYLHFATHGFFNDASPLLSSLVLAQPNTGSKEDGFLTAREIFDLDLSAEMVVLSACNTARGVQRTGDGVIGLTWALFVAGCPTQVVSQWAVDDASTATLMTRFYGNLSKGKLGKGAALRQASLSLMSDPKHAHPYYWAPFVLMGDWR